MNKNINTCSTDNLDAALARCDKLLSSFDASSQSWEIRMVNLSTNWDNIRKLLLEAVLSCEGLPLPNRCHMCLEGKVCIRCHDCPKKFFCPSCDQDVHSLLPFHDRDGYVNGFFQAILPTVTIDESGIKRIVGRQV